MQRHVSACGIYNYIESQVRDTPGSIGEGLVGGLKDLLLPVTECCLFHIYEARIY